MVRETEALYADLRLSLNKTYTNKAVQSTRTHTYTLTPAKELNTALGQIIIIIQVLRLHFLVIN